MNTEAQKKARKKYKSKTKRITLDFTPQELDLYNFVVQQSNKQAYIKRLIISDINNSDKCNNNPDKIKENAKNEA